MIRVVNEQLTEYFFSGYVRRNCRLCRIRSFSLVVSGCTDGYDDLEERVRCVFMGGDLTWNRVGSVESKNPIYRSIQSPRSVSFRPLNHNASPISKNKGTPPIVALFVVQSSQRRPMLHPSSRPNPTTIIKALEATRNPQNPLPVNIRLFWHILLLHPPIGGLRIALSPPCLPQ